MFFLQVEYVGKISGNERYKGGSKERERNRELEREIEIEEEKERRKNIDISNTLKLDKIK